MKKVKILDKEFAVSITREEIESAIQKMATKLNEELKDEDVTFLGILNGSFMFASDLFRKITFPCRISFLKLASYQGSSSTGSVKQLIGLNENLKDKTVVILEDIVDSGITLETIIKQLSGYEPKSIKIATFLFKPEAYKKDFDLDYVGIEIPNDFIVGYGLDYNGYGRNMEAIYTVVEE
jgi:hypoxanthine phosphoribosyltransferase